MRAQILATEHWSLLATRSMTWSEVMSRIVIHLTVLSASLVVLALIAQPNGFGLAFWVLSIEPGGGSALAGYAHRPSSAQRERRRYGDAARNEPIRSAYELDPAIERYLVTSRYDDSAGLMASYLMGNRRSTLGHVVASTGMFINVVNGLVAGTLGALVAASADAPPWLIAPIGTAAAWPTSAPLSRSSAACSAAAESTVSTPLRPGPARAPQFTYRVRDICSTQEVPGCASTRMHTEARRNVEIPHESPGRSRALGE